MYLSAVLTSFDNSAHIVPLPLSSIYVSLPSSYLPMYLATCTVAREYHRTSQEQEGSRGRSFLTSFSPRGRYRGRAVRQWSLNRGVEGIINAELRCFLLEYTHIPLLLLLCCLP